MMHRNASNFPRPIHRRQAFSFVEVLFAVIILGIGFVMIAGIFPAAIQQTAAVSDETQGTLMARDAIQKLQNIADSQLDGTGTNNLFPTTETGAVGSRVPTVVPLSPAVMKLLGSDIYSTADPRFGWVGFYRRDDPPTPVAGSMPFPGAPYAQVFIIALENPNFPKYIDTAAPANPTGFSQTVVPPPIPEKIYNVAAPAAATINAKFVYDQSSQSTHVTLNYASYTAGTTGGPNGATGAFILVASGLATPARTDLLGRIYRLGVPLPPPTGPSVVAGQQDFQLQFVGDPPPAQAGDPYYPIPTDVHDLGANVKVFIIGAAPAPDTTGGFTGPYTGPNQDIAALSAYIRVNTTNN